MAPSSRPVAAAVNPAKKAWNRRARCAQNAAMLLRTITRLAAGVPPGWAGVAASVASPLCAGLAGRDLRVWEANLRAAGLAPPAGRLAARHPVYHQILLQYETLAMLGGRSFRVEVDGREHLRRALGMDRGIIVATAHVGNWHVGARLLVELTGRPVHSLAGIQMARGWTRGLRLAYRRRGIRVHTRRTATRRLLAVLRGRGVVALHLDGDQHAGAGAATRGACVLSRRSGAPILGAVCERIAPGSLHARFWPPLEGGPAAPTPQRLETLLLELLRGRTGQWPLFRPVWRAA